MYLKALTMLAAVVVAGSAWPAMAAPIVFEAGGAVAADIQATVDAFRAALGAPNNGNDPGQAGGRREINWDGGGSTDTTSAPTPFNGFQDSRGVQLTTPGTGLVQGPPSGGAQGGLAGLFANLTYGGIFGTFSDPRLFVPVGSNVTDGLFSIPGTAGTVPAAVRGFGAVFTDVDLPDTTMIEFFDLNGNPFYQDFVPVGTSPDRSLSFLGVIFDAGELASRVRITTGTTALGPNDNPANGVDVVAMDDFLYAEPQAVVAAPEPGTLALAAAAGALLLLLAGPGHRRWAARSGAGRSSSA